MDHRKLLKLWGMLYVLTAIVCLINFLLLPETIISGVRVSNGVRTLMRSSKAETLLTAMLIPLAGPYFWKTRVKKLDRKIAEHPNLNSYKIRRFWTAAAAWLFSAMGLIVGIGILALNP